jgi:phage shock protein A
MGQKSGLFWIAALHYNAYKYDHAWLMEVAACAMARGDTSLARSALYEFSAQNNLCGLEERIVKDLWEILDRVTQEQAVEFVLDEQE